MDSISETRLAAVYPELATKIRQIAEQLASEGIYIRVTAGLRTVEEQDSLYAQGRTSPGQVVTNARGGQSYHNFGMAVDCIPSVNDVNLPYEPDWNDSHPAWKRMIELAEAAGLNCGADWVHFKDMPHFQLTGKWPIGAPPDEALNLVNQSFQAVWDEAYGPVTT